MTTEHIEHLLGTLAVVGPIAGLVIGAAVGARRKQLLRMAANGYVIGSTCLFTYMVWTLLLWGPFYETHVRTPTAWKQDQPKDMRELIDFDVAQAVVLTTAAMVGTLAMAVCVWALAKRRMQIAFYSFFLSCVFGAVIGLWCAYNWHCRYDPQTDYFGLEKVRVLGVNFAMFLATGAALGVLWAQLATWKPVAGLPEGSGAEPPEPSSQPAIEQPN